jgi:lambda family phage minor tail protein L
MNPSLTAELYKLAPSAIIELYELDCTAQGGSVFRFHNGTNSLSQNLVWKGNTYTRFPIDVTGFELSGDGAFPRPKLRVSNALSAVTTLLLSYKELLGAKVTRKRTLKKFLDAVNFPGGVNATADTTAEFADDIYYIDRKVKEDRNSVEFELAAATDLAGVFIPRRQIIENSCFWKYRGTECG